MLLKVTKAATKKADGLAFRIIRRKTHTEKLLSKQRTMEDNGSMKLEEVSNQACTTTENVCQIHLQREDSQIEDGNLACVSFTRYIQHKVAEKSMGKGTQTSVNKKRELEWPCEHQQACGQHG